MSQEKRAYHSKSRGIQAARTRSRILCAAKTLFQSEGFDRVTIGRIAKEAEVATPTLYALFKSKRGVLQALMDEALPVTQFEALVEAGRQEKCPKRRLKITAQLARQLYDNERELMDILRGASVVAPEFKELEQERESRRYARQEESVRALMEENVLAKGLTLAKARDLFWAFTGRDLYRMLTIERGWTSDEYERWLSQLLISSLLNNEV